MGFFLILLMADPSPINSIHIVFAYGDHSIFNIGIFLSIVGVAFIIFSWWYLKLTQHALSRLVIWISIADAIFVTPVFLLLLIPGMDETRCVVSILIAHYGVVCSFCWATCFTHAVKASIEDQDESVIKKNFKYYFWISAIIPIPSVIGAAYTQFVSYDPIQRVCFHDLSIGKIDVSFMFFNDMFYFVAMLVSLYFSIVAMLRIRKLFGKEGWDFLKIVLYPFLLMVVWFPKLINDCLIQLGGTTAFSKEAATFIEILVGAQGFTNAVVYGLSHVVITGYKEKCCKRKRSARSLCFGSCIKPKPVEKDPEEVVHSSRHHSSDTELRSALIYRSKTARSTSIDPKLMSMTTSSRSYIAQ